jgi:glycosyltransferase involved in cell wall biosynthesis
MARVVLILRPDKGGAFNHVVQLAEALTERSHEVFVVGPHAPRRDEISARVIPLEIGRPISVLADRRAVGSFARIVRRLEPDLVHAHGSKAGVVARLARAAYPRVPVVFTPHLYAFDNYFARPAQRRAYRVIERALAPAASRVIGVCESERRLAAEIGPAGRTRTVHNGVEAVSLASVDPRVAELSGRGPVICTVAELRESKGVVTLIEAMSRVHAEHPDAHLVIAGDGDERPRVESRIRELELADSVTLLGATRGADAVLAGANVFVNPAYAEAFPYTVIEAMSAGLPVVATDVGGTREAIEGGAGVLVPPGEADPLSQAIIGVLREPGRADEMGRAAAEAHKARFTTERMVAGTIGVYAELVPGFAMARDVPSTGTGPILTR